jgi:hypothetical protein
MRFKTLLEQELDDLADGKGVVQIVTPESEEVNQLRFCFYKDGEFVNRPLTIGPEADVADRIGEVVVTMASLARTFTADDIDALVEELGEEKILELSVLIEELGKTRLAEILAAETADSFTTTAVAVDTFKWPVTTSNYLYGNPLSKTNVAFVAGATP